MQGEGKYVGCRQVFVRLTGCNLHCAYCDTQLRAPKYCSFETKSGSMKFYRIPNPVSADKVAKAVQAMLDEVPTHSVAFTGGEPLLHCDFIRAVAKRIRARIFLETNGTLFEEMERINDCVDIISMDLKLPGVVEADLWESHRRFLEVAGKKAEIYAKVVISADTTAEELLRAVELVAEAGVELLVLQPVTPRGGVEAAPPERVLALQTLALKILNDVRVIPQTHRVIGVN